MKRFHYSFIFSLLFFGGTGLFAQSQNNLDKGLRFVEQNAEKWELTETDYAGALVSDMYTNNKTGITYIYLIQAHKGIPINNAITPIAIAPNGKINVTRHGFVANLKDKVNSVKPSLSPTAAIKSAVAHLGIQASSMPALLRSNSEKNIYEFGQAEFSENEITVKLTYVENNGQYSLAWALAINEKDNTDYYNTFVDALTGEVISKNNYTKSCSFHKGQYDKHVGCNHEKAHKTPLATQAETNTAIAASGSYSVFALPAESPIHGEFVNVVNPHFSDVSPFGWHDTDGVEGAEFNITRGNNVYAFLDKDDDNASDGAEPNGGDTQSFDTEYDALGQNEVNEEVATVNLFYMNNIMHDITARTGFDEQAGNFQQTNYSGQGQGNDFVVAKASAGFELATPSLNNATFGTPPDGLNGVMNMFLWTNPSGNLTIDEPEELAGFIADVGTAAYGNPVPMEGQDPISGKVVVATDGVPGAGTTSCNPLSNGDEIIGNIALIDRGLCFFAEKSFRAQEAGAIAVIICNVDGGGGTDGLSSFGMAADPDGTFANQMTIPTISLGSTDCDRIRASLLSNIDVELTLQQRPPVGPDFLDGSFDNGIIAHELGHGVSNRLIGGPSAASCLTNSEQMGEGISDYFGLALTVEEGDAGVDSRGIGTFASAQVATGRGIRRFPYSTDLDVNPQTFDDIKTSGVPHPLGEIWAITLWEIHWAFIDQFGLDTSWENEDSGNFKAMSLIIEGMKLTACNPSMIDTRDGILNADSLLNGGVNGELLWTTFAKRGLGYLANDGAGSDDQTDGTESFEPLPTAIQSLKIQEVVNNVVKPGEEVVVTITAQNHIPDTQTGVIITSVIPEGLSYVGGSSTMPATIDNGILTITVGDMALNDEIEMTYSAIADGGIKSETLYFDDIEEPDYDAYSFGSFEGSSLWSDSDGIANSGDIAWYAAQIVDTDEVDFWMNTPSLSVFGDQPALRFFHRYETEAAADAGFVQISIDGGISFLDIKDKFIRNGYPNDVQFGTFAIPLLEGFSGSTDGQFVDSYIDLTEFKGQDIVVRFRFGTDDNTIAEGDNIGWFVDDIEILDLTRYMSNTCISSEASEVDVCAAPNQIIIDSDGTTSTDELEAEGVDIGVAPNPASDYVTISLQAKKKTSLVLSLTSIDGRVIKSQALVVDSSKSVRSFDTSSLEAGMYLIQIKSETAVTTKKVVIQ